MSIGYARAAVLLHRAFHRRPIPQRLHILIRFLTCPFVRALDAVPAGARMLDVGAGHGTWGLLALAVGAAEVICVEPDLRKAYVSGRDPRLRWIAGYDDAVRGTFDAVSIFDVAYLMTVDARVAMFRSAFERLKPGGLFILKELDPAHPLKSRWARYQEWLNRTFLHITLGDHFVQQTRDEVQETLEGLGFREFQARAIDAGYPHAHILYTARRP
jgi:SAM-dependent methyltransferase